MSSPSTDRRLGLTGNKAYKAPCDVATTANISLSGEQTIDGVTTSSSRVLVWNQSNTVDNGIWDTSTGSWSRAVDCNTNQDIAKGTQVLVTGGTSYAGQIFEFTSANPIIPGTSAITIVRGISSSTLEARLASAASEADGDALVAVKQPLTGAVARTQHQKNQELISVRDFGAVGDWNGTTGTDDTTALQAAFNAGVPVVFPDNCKCKITGALTATYPIYMGDNSYIQPTGSGYTALTISPLARSGPWRVVIGDGNAAFTGNGIIFGNPTNPSGYTQILIHQLVARKCSGKGVEINNLWESTVLDLQAYGCGSASNTYALAINSNAGDSTNTTFVGRITVAQSDTLALYLSAQFCTFPFIYVEEVSTPATKFVWLNKIVDNVFERIRIYNAGTAQAWIGTGENKFGLLNITSSLVFDNTDSFGNEHVIIEDMECAGAVSENSPASSAAATCLISVGGGEIATLTTGTSGGSQLGARWSVRNCDITTLNIGRNAIGRYTIASMEAVKFGNCTIGTLSVTQAADCSFALVDGTKVGAFSGTLTGSIRMDRAEITPAFALQGDTASGANYYSKLYANATQFKSTFDLTGNVVGEVVNSTIDGNMTRSTPATTNNGVVFIGTGCNGTVAAAYNAAPAASDTLNQFGKGKRIDNIVGAVGNPKGWICTVAGNPGTWVSEGNL